MIPKHRICIFRFNNGGEIHVAVTTSVVNGREEKSFDEFLQEAKAIVWLPDETRGRDEFVSFEVGPYIVVKGAGS